MAVLTQRTIRALGLQNVKRLCCLQTTDKRGLSFSDRKDQCSLQVVTATLNRSCHFENKNIQSLVMKCVKAAYSVTMNIFRKKNIFFLNHL